MKKTVLVLLIGLFSFNVGFTQYDEATQSKIKVKFFAAEELLSEKEYSKAIDKVKEIEALTGEPKASVVQNIKVKSYIGLGMYGQAKKELDILYKLGPTDEVLRDIAAYETKIDDGIAEEKAKKERERLAEIKRQENEKLEEELKREKAEKDKEERRLQGKAYYNAYVNNKWFNYFRNEHSFYSKRKEGEIFFYANSYYGDISDYIPNEKLIIPYYNTSWRTKDNILSIHAQNTFCYIDSEGYCVLSAEIGNIKIIDGHYFSSGLAPVIYQHINNNSEYFYGYINLKGKVVIKLSRPIANYLTYFPFSEGLAEIHSQNNKSGFIDVNGNWVIPQIYDAPPKYKGGFHEGLAVVCKRIKKKLKYGFINKNGEVVIPFEFDGAKPFSGGKAEVYVRKKWKTVNTKGEIIE